jgi:hypothetical protein
MLKDVFNILDGCMPRARLNRDEVEIFAKQYVNGKFIDKNRLIEDLIGGGAP